MNLEKARYCADRILVLPLYADLEEKDVDRIVKIVKKQGNNGGEFKTCFKR